MFLERWRGVRMQCGKELSLGLRVGYSGCSLWLTVRCRRNCIVLSCIRACGVVRCSAIDASQCCGIERSDGACSSVFGASPWCSIEKGTSSFVCHDRRRESSGGRLSKPPQLRWCPRVRNIIDSYAGSQSKQTLTPFLHQSIHGDRATVQIHRSPA
jgi:hypothetical protein